MSIKVADNTRKAGAIVGTAGTWKLCPWDDTSIDIFGLNDGYVLGMRAGYPQGLPRANGWYDFHPFHQMAFRPANQTQVSAFEVPTGAYLRPDGHLKWLKTRPFPVYVNTVPPDWPAHVVPFPREAIEAKHGHYFCSSPAWMLVHLIEQGYNEIHVYGIHLATEWEYVEQRPNFEFWLRYAMDRGVKIVLPNKCPLLKSKHVYAYEPKPNLPVQAAGLVVAQVKHEGAKLHEQLTKTPWYARGVKADLEARLAVVNLELADAKQAQHRAQAIAMAV
jgi:hypothetical protein